MSAATDAAAAAVAPAPPPEKVFPAVGTVVRMQVVRSNDNTGALTGITNLGVAIGGEVYDCGWSGAFAAEITAARFVSFTGRRVLVTLVGGDLCVAYTVNWSD